MGKLTFPLPAASSWRTDDGAWCVVVFCCVFSILATKAQRPVYASGVKMIVQNSSLDLPNRGDQETDVGPEKIKSLVRQLGSDRYPLRVAAMGQLIAIGEPALPYLKQAEDLRYSRDLEVKLSAQTIRKSIAKRSAKTLADEFRSGEKTLPGWSAFASRYGEGDQQRELYAMMYQSQSSVLTRMFESDGFRQQELYKALQGTTSTAQGFGGTRQMAGSVGNAATGLFMLVEHADRGVYLTGAQLQFALGIYYRSDVQGAVNKSEYWSLVMRQIQDFLELAPSRQPFMNLRLRIYATYSSPVFLDDILDIISDTNQAIAIRISMLQALPGLKTYATSKKRIIDFLPDYFGDDSRLGSFLLTFRSAKESDRFEETVIDVQMRDTVLLTSILMEDGNPESYGFAPEALRVKKSIVNARVFDPRFSGFASDTQREAAFNQWKLREKGEDNQ